MPLPADESIRAVLDVLPDAIAVHRNDRLLYVNKALLELVGSKSAGDVLKDPVSQLLGNHVPKSADMLLTSSKPIEARVRQAQGSVLVVEITSTGMPYGGSIAVLSVLRDTTDHHQMQAQLLLADRLASVGQLAAGVAHEINNPMAYVTANLGFATDHLREMTAEVRDRSPDTPAEVVLAAIGARLDEVSEALLEARQGTMRVRQIVRDLRTFSRDEEERRPVDVRRVLESSINVAWNEIRHRARLVKLFSEVPRVDATEARLGQIFLNLLLNAAQAIPEGAAESNEIRVSTSKNSLERVVIEVRDTGTGISPENLARIFDPFFTTKPSGVGTGLGLAIVHRIVTSLGGEVEVDTEIGKGTAFLVSFPASGNTKMGSSTGIFAKVIPVRRAKILVVDDEPLVLRAVQRMLQGQHEVTTAAGGKEALTLLGSDARFDAILCDLMMPEVSGIDLHAELSRRMPDQASRMVFLTGGAFTPAAKAFVADHQYSCLEKPLDMHTLGETLRKLIE